MTCEYAHLTSYSTDQALNSSGITRDVHYLGEIEFSTIFFNSQHCYPRVAYLCSAIMAGKGREEHWEHVFQLACFMGKEGESRLLPPQSTSKNVVRLFIPSILNLLE